MLHGPSATEILYILLALTVGFILGLYSRRHVSSYQNRGEAILTHALRTHFVPPEYHLLNHVTLPLKNGTTQVDHILVSRFGVFVIEVKDYSGWIFANPMQRKWTQVIFEKKFKFQNPIFQNYLHLRAVQDLLDFLPQNAFHSVVVFTGKAEFKTDVPAGVYSLAKFVDHVSKQNTEVMSINRMQFCVGRLETSRFLISGKTDLEHIQSLERKHGIVA